MTAPHCLFHQITAVLIEIARLDDTNRLIFGDLDATAVAQAPTHTQRQQTTFQERRHVGTDSQVDMLDALVAGQIRDLVFDLAVGQQLLMACMDSSVDLNIYRERREAMAQVLSAAGVEFNMPRGAFYFFPKSQVEDERLFVDALLKERVLAVPGRGFGKPGYIRLTFCVGKETILNSAESIAKAVKNCR